MAKHYPCGRCVLSCGAKGSRECCDGRYAVERWGGSCGWYDFDDDVYMENIGKVEEDFTYED